MTIDQLRLSRRAITKCTVGSAGPTYSAGSATIATTSRPLHRAIQRDAAIGPKNSSETIDGSARDGKNGEWTPPVSVAQPMTNTCAVTLMQVNEASTHSGS